MIPHAIAILLTLATPRVTASRTGTCVTAQEQINKLA
jgi:hypothetical protein